MNIWTQEKEDENYIAIYDGSILIADVLDLPVGSGQENANEIIESHNRKIG